jgi:hypothetical protein
MRVVNSEPLVQFNNNNNGAKVQWQPTLNISSNNNGPSPPYHKPTNQITRNDKEKQNTQKI